MMLPHFDVSNPQNSSAYCPHTMHGVRKVIKDLQSGMLRGRPPHCGEGFVDSLRSSGPTIALLGHDVCGSLRPVRERLWRTRLLGGAPEGRFLAPLSRLWRVLPVGEKVDALWASFFARPVAHLLCQPRLSRRSCALAHSLRSFLASSDMHPLCGKNVSN